MGVVVDRPKNAAPHIRRVVIALLFLVGLLVSPAGVSAQSIEEMEFIDKPITSILLSVGRAAGVTVIPDNTVSGRASYYFRSGSFDAALQGFLDANGLFLEKTDTIYHVSRIRIDFESRSGMIDIDAVDVSLDRFLSSLSARTRVPIVYDRIPSRSVTIHADAIGVVELVEIAVGPGQEYDVERTGSQIEILHIDDEDRSMTEESEIEQHVIVGNEGKISIDTTNARLFALLDEFFTKNERDFVLLKQSDTLLERISIRDQSFISALTLLLDAGNASFEEVDGVFYILDEYAGGVDRRVNVTDVIEIRNSRASVVAELLPRSITDIPGFAVDDYRNAIFISARPEQLEMARELVRQLDQTTGDREYRRYELTNITGEDLVSLLPEELLIQSPIVLPRQNAIVLLSDVEEDRRLREYIALIDRRHGTEIVDLRFIRTEDLLNNIPPAVTADNIVETSDPTRFYLRGNDATRTEFLQQLQSIDRPIPQLRYDLLVIQYQESDEITWEFGAQNRLLAAGDRNQFIGEIGNLLSLSFDVLSVFGYAFGVNLNTAISNSRAHVLADTTLNALSGESVSFQNTSTFRYRDMETDPDTGERVITGVVREIVSGLIVDIDGWVSGDGMVSMTVGATVSKRGADVSDGAGNPPPTSEKVVETRVRASEGAPVVIGGLLQQETETVVQGVPFLSTIPLIGRLFRHERESTVTTEFVIYIVPHVARSDDAGPPLDERLTSDYVEFSQVIAE